MDLKRHLFLTVIQMSPFSQRDLIVHHQPHSWSLVTTWVPTPYPSVPSVSQNFTRFDLGNSRHRCSLPNWSVGAAGQELNTVQSLGNDSCLQSSQTTELFLKNSRVRSAKKTTRKPAEEGETTLACLHSSLLF